MKIGIYSFINKMNGKKYIGMSVDIKKRTAHHVACLHGKYHSNIKLQNAWNKYGEENFEIVVLEKVNKNEIDLLPEKEKFYINKFDSFKNGYNKSLGGDGTNGFIADEVRLKKMSELMKGNKFGLGTKRTDEQKKRMSQGFKRRTDLEAHKERGIKLFKSPEFREKSIRASIGNKWGCFKKSDEFKKHLSEIRKGDKNPFYGKAHSDESLKKMSQKSKKTWSDPEYKDKICKMRKIYMSTPEYKNAMSKAIRGEKHGCSLVSEKDVIIIRMRYLNGEKLGKIHTDYPIFSKSGLGKICRQESWKHIPNNVEELKYMLINYQS